MRGLTLTPLEIATGSVFGSRPVPEPLPVPGRSSPLEALEPDILQALLHPPCLVSFSGGCDSSTVLAAAAAVARREGLPLPIPVTNVFPAAPGTDETSWQQRVVDHLALKEWVRVEHGGELDLVGPYARRVLRRHGLLWPSNIHFHAPILEAAQGGSLLTGVGGDDLFAAIAVRRVTAVLTGMKRARPHDLLRIGFAFAPARLRRRVIARRDPLPLRWLTAAGRRAAAAALAAEIEPEPPTLHARVAWWRSRRYLAVATEGLGVIAEDAGVRIAHPLLAPRLWAVAARLAEPGGFSRGEGMRSLFGSLLPADVLARRSKAYFDEAFWCADARSLMRGWDPARIVNPWVDAPALLRAWRTEQPPALSSTLLQALWLQLTPDRVAQPFRGLG